MTLDAPNFQYIEDDPAVSGDRGTLALVVRKDVAGTLVDTDGDYAPLQLDADGNLRVTGSVSVPGTINTSESWATGTLANGAETAVAGSAVQVLAANASRKKLIVQNVGLGDVRIGVSGVTATSGIKLTRNGSLLFEMPHCPTQAIFAIRDGAVSSTVLAQEVT